MKAVILGSGSAVPDPDRGNPSQAVLVDDTILLFDCGERTTVNLVRAGINPMDVDFLFFTHLHWDHMCDYGYLIMTTWNCGRTKLLRVFGPAGTRHMSEATIYGAHKADVGFVRGYIRALPPHIRHKPIDSPAVEVQDIDVGYVYSEERFKVIAGEVEHHQRVGLPSVGYRVESPYGVVAISGDTRPCRGMVELARGADVLIHDTAFLDEIIEERQMWSHSGPTGAGRVAREAGVKTLVLTHLGPYTSAQPAVDMASMYYGQRRSPDVWERIVDAARKEFAGNVLLAHDAMIIEIPSDSGTNTRKRP